MNNIPCKECGAYNGHGPKCSLMDEKCAKQMLKEYYEAWLQVEIKNRERIKWADKRTAIAKKEAEFWKGKFTVVKTENNKLRKKSEKQLQSK